MRAGAEYFPINQMLDKMNISDEDLESMTEEVMEMMGGNDSDDDEEEGFTPGGAATFPFLKQIFGENFNLGASSGEAEGKAKPLPVPKRRIRKRKNPLINANTSIFTAPI